MTDKFATLRRLNGERTRVRWADLSNNRDIDATVIWDTGPEDTLKHNANPHDGVPLTDIDYQFCCESANQMDALLGEIAALERTVKALCTDNNLRDMAEKYLERARKEETARVAEDGGSLARRAVLGGMDEPF